MPGISDPKEVAYVLREIAAMDRQFVNDRKNIFARAHALLLELLSTVQADDCLLDEKDDAIAAVNEGHGVADDDLWAAMKNERDRLRREKVELQKFYDKTAADWSKACLDILDQNVTIDRLRRQNADLLAACLAAAEVVEDEECRPDHRGLCQAHNLQPVGRCWAKMVKDAVANGRNQ